MLRYNSSAGRSLTLVSVLPLGPKHPFYQSLQDPKFLQFMVISSICMEMYIFPYLHSPHLALKKQIEKQMCDKFHAKMTSVL